MELLKYLILSVAVLYASAIPQRPIKNTIFGDERLEGEIFEHLDDFNDITLYDDHLTNPYRLPRTTAPSHYDIFWTIDIERLTYSGTVVITITATEENVNEIVLHSDHTELINVTLTQGATAVPITYYLDTPYQFLRIRPNVNLAYNNITPVEYTLTIEFGAEMRENMNGIYKSWFTNGGNDTTIRWMASTQFQATAARYAFPCYDEPRFKATFDITIRRPTTHRSWSNTRIGQTVAASVAGYEDDVYLRTPVMSTYLLALIVAEYDDLQYFQNNIMRYEVIARPGAMSDGQGQYSFDVGMQLLDAMSNHTAIDYFSINANLKMTQAAIPDFSAGAMENWGLLTYREAYLMYDENHSNGYFKQIIAYILSHEIAHMWFGNLVTCEWWDVLWLNEGFARYYQYFLTSWVEDYMGLETRFITEQVHTALLSDSANNPHPLSTTGIGSPGAVSAMFSTLSYNKGAAVIRMTEHLLGHEVHRAGLRNYLVDKSFDMAQPIDLFTSLENAGIAAGALTEYGSDFSFVDYYKTWTEQGGHPVLQVQVNHGTGDMTILQRRFNINYGYAEAQSNWIIPITFATASNPDFENTKPTHIISDTLSIINRGSVGNEWIIFNKQQIGFYRVNYDDYTWDLIILALRGSDRTLIHEYNRAQIVNDVFQFARSGIMSYTRAFNILSFLEFETEYAPWVAAMTGFSWIRGRLAGTAQLADLEAMISRWATNVMNEVGYYPAVNETFMRSYLRYQLASIMCNMGNEACRTAAVDQFNQLMNNGVEVPVDNRNFVYCNGLRQGTTAHFDFLWNRFLTHNVYTEKIVLLQTLGCTPHQTSLYTFMDSIVQENYIIRRQDYTTAWNTAVSGNEGNTQLAFAYIQANLATVTNAFGNPATPLSYVSSRLRTEAEITAFQTWATANQATLDIYYQTIYNGAETSRQSLVWAASVSPDFDNYLVNGNDDITSTTAAPIVTEAMTTVTPLPLEEPATPALPSSASKTFVSLSLLTLTAAIRFMS